VKERQQKIGVDSQKISKRQTQSFGKNMKKSFGKNMKIQPGVKKERKEVLQRQKRMNQT